MLVTTTHKKMMNIIQRANEYVIKPKVIMTKHNPNKYSDYAITVTIHCPRLLFYLSAFCYFLFSLSLSLSLLDLN